MGSYWYSTNGMNQQRLSNCHLSLLDQAFERHVSIELFDDEVFGRNVSAIASPYQGTMTAGDLHYGLYRQPPMWRMSDTSLDTLVFMDTDLDSLSQIDAIKSIGNNSSSTNEKIRNNNENKKSRHKNGNNKRMMAVNLGMKTKSERTAEEEGDGVFYRFVMSRKSRLITEEESCNICCNIS